MCNNVETCFDPYVIGTITITTLAPCWMWFDSHVSNLGYENMPPFTDFLPNKCKNNETFFLLWAT